MRRRPAHVGDRDLASVAVVTERASDSIRLLDHCPTDVVRDNDDVVIELASQGRERVGGSSHGVRVPHRRVTASNSSLEIASFRGVEMLESRKESVGGLGVEDQVVRVEDDPLPFPARNADEPLQAFVKGDAVEHEQAVPVGDLTPADFVGPLDVDVRLQGPAGDRQGRLAKLPHGRRDRPHRAESEQDGRQQPEAEP